MTENTRIGLFSSNNLGRILARESESVLPGRKKGSPGTHLKGWYLT